MISFSKKDEEIIELWSEVFGDSREEVIFFLDNAKNAECLTYRVDDKAVSMLFLVDCCINGNKGKYIYAACTYKEYEGRGFMSELISYSGKLNYNYLCLIPANDGLIDFYQKRGFDKQAEISSLEFEQIEEINEYLFEGYNLSKPIVMICEV